MTLLDRAIVSVKLTALGLYLSYEELRADGHENVGVVLQACLRRTLADVSSLAALRPNVRLCKGIYVESASIAFTDREAVRANFVCALEALLDAGAYVAVRR